MKEQKVSLMNLENQIIKVSATSISSRRVFESIKAHVSRSVCSFTQQQFKKTNNKLQEKITVDHKNVKMRAIINPSDSSDMSACNKKTHSNKRPRPHLPQIENTQFNAINLTVLFSHRSFPLSDFFGASLFSSQLVSQPLSIFLLLVSQLSAFSNTEREKKKNYENKLILPIQLLSNRINVNT